MARWPGPFPYALISGRSFLVHDRQARMRRVEVGTRPTTVPTYWLHVWPLTFALPQGDRAQRRQCYAAALHTVTSTGAGTLAALLLTVLY